MRRSTASSSARGMIHLEISFCGHLMPSMPQFAMQIARTCPPRRRDSRAKAPLRRHPRADSAMEDGMDVMESALVSAQQIEQFARDGYLVIENLLPSETVAAVRARFAPL